MARLALVTGGSRGIGAAISKGLTEAGYNVVANFGGNEEAAKAFTDETGIPTYKWDVGDFEACKAGVEQVVADHGAIEVLVNNAGITWDKPMHKMEPKTWNAVIRTDLDSCFNMTSLVFNAMRDAGFGRIINISSINGQKGQFGQANYAAAKAGMIGLTKTLSQEGARKGITANVVAPGYIGTEMVRAVPEDILKTIVAQIPVGRLGEADEIARCVTFLAADEAGFITGSTLSVNGGQYLA